MYVRGFLFYRKLHRAPIRGLLLGTIEAEDLPDSVKKAAAEADMLVLVCSAAAACVYLMRSQSLPQRQGGVFSCHAHPRGKSAPALPYLPPLPL